jgi:hypothetical protein
MALRGSPVRHGVGGLCDRSHRARAQRALSNRQLDGCGGTPGSAARFVEAEDEFWVTGTPCALDL